MRIIFTPPGGRPQSPPRPFAPRNPDAIPPQTGVSGPLAGIPEETNSSQETDVPEKNPVDHGKPAGVPAGSLAAFARSIRSAPGFSLWEKARFVAEEVAYRVGCAVAPSLFNPPPLLTPEIVEILLRSGQEPASDEEADLQELTEADYELLADDDAHGPLPRPTITLPEVGYVYSARDIIKFLKSPIVTWLDRYDHASPGEIPLDDEDQTLKIFAERGIKFEKDYWQRWKDEMDFVARWDATAEHAGAELERYANTLANLRLRFSRDGSAATANARFTYAAVDEYDDLRRTNYQAACDRRWEDTLEAMRQGRDVIYQAFLRSPDGKLEGAADFLVKVPNEPGQKSEFGDYHYEVWDVKLSKEPKAEHVVQVAFYTDLLTQIQGVRPRDMRIVPGFEGNRKGTEPGAGRVAVFKTDAYFDYYQRLKEMFFQYQSQFVPDLDRLPEIPKQKDFGRRKSFVKHKIQERDALSQIAGILSLHIGRLRDAGIWTMSQLADTPLAKVPHIPEATFGRLKRQASMQVATRGRLELLDLRFEEKRALHRAGLHYVRDLAESAPENIDGIAAERLAAIREKAAETVKARGLDKPQYDVSAPDAANPGRGLEALPPSSKNDVFFDIEGYMHEEANLEYLLGNTYVDYSNDPKGEIKFRDFWAHTWDEEKKAFEDLVDWFMARWREDPAMHVFHYASYEITALKRLAAKYATREREVDEMLGGDLFVDLYKVVRQGMTVGAESYSLKKIEKLYLGSRSAEVVTALGSVEAYRDWLLDPDGATWDVSKKLADIRNYNREDCESTLHLARWLWNLQRERGIAYVDPKELRRKAEEERTEAERARAQAEKTRRQLANEEFRKRVARVKEKVQAMLKKSEGEQKRILELLHHVLDFYWRESKPALWAKQHRHEMTQEQLVEDADCLGELERDESKPPYHPLIAGNTLSVLPPAPEAGDAAPEGLNDGDLALAADIPPFSPSSRSRSLVYTYRFDPKTGTTLQSGVQYSLADIVGPEDKQQKMFSKSAEVDDDAPEKNSEYRCEIVDIDREAGVVRIKLGPKILRALENAPPPRIHLTPRRSRSLVYAYKFDPAQDTKLSEGDSCFFAHDLRVRCKIEKLDTVNGVVEVRVGPKALGILNDEMPPELGLIPDEYVSPRVIEESILRTLERFTSDEKGDRVDGKRYLPKNLVNFLRKEGPNPSRPVMPEGVSTKEGVFRAVRGLNGQTLVLQGPPGTGKTYHAAYAIVRLIKEAREQDRPIRIGVSALSHPSILNLMETVQRLAREEGVEFEGLKVGDDPFNELVEEENMGFAKTAGEAALNFEGVDLVGGTAWAFSHEDFAGQFDYLFIDEASQMSLANIVGMAPSARNMVLLGDQRQLPQPIQGSHPGESGLSALDYFLKDSKVIESDRGVFLGTTFRNHPDIVALYSGPIYEGQVAAAPANARQRIALPSDPEKIRHVGRETGLVYVPVAHEGNLHKSPEEADVVAQVVRELVGRDYTHWDNMTRPLDIGDIMIISPYALQVKKIRERLGKDATVGTVHKFQGREAPVTVVSFATSNASPFSRAMDHWANLRMLNTAISRARGLVVIVGNPKLENIRARTTKQMEMLNFYYKILRAAGWRGSLPDGAYTEPAAIGEDGDEE